MKALFTIILISLLLFSCKEDEPVIFKAYDLEIKLKFSPVALDVIDELETIKVNVQNMDKNYITNHYPDSLGVLKIHDLESGTYTFSVSDHISEDADIIHSIHANKSMIITENTIDSMQITSSFTQKRGQHFVIKEYYYNGSLTATGKGYLHDQYIEIYNNSADTLLADSLLLVELAASSNGPNQFGYLQDSFIVVKTIWAFPNDQHYPISPGQGFVVAVDAANHQSDTAFNPLSPVDLGNADFEFWSDMKPDGDIDFEAKNMINKLWVYKGSDYFFHLLGGSAMALVKLPGNVDEYIKANYVTIESSNKTNYYCKIDNQYVTDAVEVTFNDSRQKNKRMDSSLDAGVTYIASEKYSGLCVRRKVQGVYNSRVVYKDTNNSSEDFEKDVTPQPGIYE